MSRRVRAAGFGLLALAAAACAAAIADGYGASAARGYGPLRPVVVLAADLPAGRRIGASEVADGLAVRRVPERFVPPGALTAPSEAVGMAPRADLTAGSYLLAAQLGAPHRAGGARRGLARGRRPVEILVSGAGALLASPGAARRSRVDVVVTEEPSGAGPGRTRVAAAAVPLLGLRRSAGSPGPGGGAAATLGLTRRQALRLIAAESFARKVTLLPGG